MYFFDMPKQEEDGPLLLPAVADDFCCWADDGALNGTGGASRLSSVPVSNLVILASGSENSYSPTQTQRKRIKIKKRKTTTKMPKPRVIGNGYKSGHQLVVFSVQEKDKSTMST